MTSKFHWPVLGGKALRVLTSAIIVSIAFGLVGFAWASNAQAVDETSTTDAPHDMDHTQHDAAAADAAVGPDVNGFEYALNAPWTKKPRWNQPVSAPKPVKGQVCPAWVHDRYTKQGPDGLWYTTWHAPIDAEFQCTFGHEHGDDPRGALAMRGWKILFGYAGHRIGHIHAGVVEAHVGYKIHRMDRLQDQTTGTSTHAGASLLVVFHQGSTTANAFTQTFHEVDYNYYNPRDGREVHTYSMAEFDDLAVRDCSQANKFKIIPQDGNDHRGRRIIPGKNCVVGQTFASGFQYEDWVTGIYIGHNGDYSNSRAYFDPHFAIFNPGRFCDLQANNVCTHRYVADYIGDDDPFSRSSNFKGDHREVYTNAVTTVNAGRSTEVWTDAVGKLVPAGSDGAIKQFVSSVTYKQTSVASLANGKDKYYDKNGTLTLPN